MAKNLKLNIKNEQLAQAVNMGSLRSKLGKKNAEEARGSEAKPKASSKDELQSSSNPKEVKEEAPRIKARSRSAFAEPETPLHPVEIAQPPEEASAESPPVFLEKEEISKPKSTLELRRQIFGDELDTSTTMTPPETLPELNPRPKQPAAPSYLKAKLEEQREASAASEQSKELDAGSVRLHQEPPKYSEPSRYTTPARPTARPARPPEKLGPTGRHVNDLYTPPPRPRGRVEGRVDNRPPVRSGDARGPRPPGMHRPTMPAPIAPPDGKEKERRRIKTKADQPAPVSEGLSEIEGAAKRAPGKVGKTKEFRDVKPQRKQETHRSFDARDRHGLRSDEEAQWRKRKIKGAKVVEDSTIRPTELSVRLPISVKDLASEMKLKASQLIAKLFMQGLAVTLNDLLEDEVVLQLLGQEFGCNISIDRTEENRIRITGKSIREEISDMESGNLHIRPPIVTFMGHVDHGKTSLIDAIRKSNRAAGEAGAITQHIGAFRCSTAVGDIAILDTPGHEAFSAMRARGADVTDIVVLVVAGDEGIRQQTIEAINHAKQAGVTIVVAINKSDKPNFNPETVYRQLAELELLPEAWGGQTITINCSAVTNEGINTLLEMLALQAEVLELRAQTDTRARGAVLESELHKGMGNVTTLLVQNGTLKRGDALVFSQHWGRVKTMRNEHGQELQEAGPSTPVEVTGLSGLPEAGEQFIVVKSEKEAREIAEARALELIQKRQKLGRKVSMENLFQKGEAGKKVLNLIIRADVQGSLEALRNALEKIHSEKVDLNIIMAGVGEISESDAQMAETSKAAILGFHTRIEAHAEALIKQLGISVYQDDIIYHAIDRVKELMAGTLDKIAEEHERGVAEVKTTFKSSQHGFIAGCQIAEGTIHRSNLVRVKRGKEIIWKGTISSLRRLKDDVREVQKGFECGILLNGFNEVLVGDLIEAYEIVYKVQEL